MMNQELQQLERRAGNLPAQVRSLGPKIQDQATLERVNKAKLYIRELRNEVRKVFEPMKKKAYAAYKEILDQYKKVEAPIIEAEKYCDRLLAEWFAEQRRQREEAERKRLEAIRKQKEEEERKLREALEAENAGKKEEAEKIINQVIETKPPEVKTPEKPKLKGVYSRIDYDFEIIDVTKIPREYMIPDETLIRKVIRASKGKVVIPGIKVIAKEIVVTRTEAYR